MKIHHLNCSSMCPLGGKHLSHIFPREIICHCLLIESRDELILIDTGLGLAQLRNPKKLGALNWLLQVQPNPQQAACEQVQALGFSLTDVRHIIPTHLDNDHAGAIFDFPAAKIHTSRLEFEAAHKPSRYSEKIRYRFFEERDPQRWEKHEFSHGENWFGFTGVRPLKESEPDLLLIPLIGHSYGHFGVAVRTPTGWLLHAGDAYYDHRELDGQGELFSMSVLQTFVHSDYTQAIRNRQRLRELRRDHPEVRIFCSHDSAEYESLK